MAKKKKNAGNRKFNDYRHDEAKRKNIPPAKIAAEGSIPLIPKAEYLYSPRRPPVLRFDPDGKPDQLPELLQTARMRALTKDEAAALAEALKTQEPWLEWAGKHESEAAGFAVDPVALHIHERVSAQAILKVAARQDIFRDLFADPEQDYREAVQFYQHDIDWTNRLILGDSLQVMSSLARRENLAGKVQMIYIDPPYGIRFHSNFQANVGDTRVTDREQDLTREPEMVKAYRDTWYLGIHSYLSYLAERLIVAKELLDDSGSMFVQISDENVQRVRQLLDEVFGCQNFVVTLLVKKKGSQKGGMLDPINDYVLWTTKNKSAAGKRFNSLFEKAFLDEEYVRTFRWVELSNGAELTLDQLSRLRGNGVDYRKEPERVEKDFPGSKIFTSENATSGGTRKNQSLVYCFAGRDFDPGITRGNCWKHTAVSEGAGLSGMDRMARAGRLYGGENQLRIKRYACDFGATAVTNWWDDIAGAPDPVYVVQTNTEIIKRCMLMTTMPGDLVLDPTCGSGTTAYVAEQWGRRWITIDTSRVAVAIARQRLLTATYEYYELKDVPAGVAGGFKNDIVAHTTSSVVANCTALDPIFAKHEPMLDKALAPCNAALGSVTAALRTRLDEKLAAKRRREGQKSITDADRRRWELPKKGARWEHWQVPFDTDPDWPKPLADAVTEYRKAWRAKMNEVNACIAANAEQEELVDQPEIVKGVVRVSGPFTVEAVQPPEMSLGDTEGKFDGEPEKLEGTFEPPRFVEMRPEFDAKNVDAYLDQMMRYLKVDGVRFPGNRQMKFSRLERLSTAEPGLHAEGRWVPEGEGDKDVEGKRTIAIAFGPQYGPVTAKMVEQVVRSAKRMGYDDLVIAGFDFDGPSQAVMDEIKTLRVHAAHIAPSVNPCMNGLLKTQPGSQLFTVFGRPRTRVDGPDKDGMYTVTMEGVDIYNPVDHVLVPTGAEKVAAWFIDSDYDGWTFCITQAFFPDRSAWEKLSKALNGPGGIIDEDRFEALSGTKSLPFPPGKHKSVAVKVIDPRGNEVMRVHELEG